MGVHSSRLQFSRRRWRTALGGIIFLTSLLVQNLARPATITQRDISITITPATERAAASEAAAFGGGLLHAGLLGQYFANPDLAGQPAFTRRDVRIRFDAAPAGLAGSISTTFRHFPQSGFSVRWTGQLMVRTSAAYAFRTLYHGGLRLLLKPAGARTWQTLLSDWPNQARQPQTKSVGIDLTAGTIYDIRVEYRNLSGPAEIKLSWSGPALPAAPLEAVSGIASNVYTEGFSDAMKMARDEWKAVRNGNLTGQDARRDSRGWPLQDAAVMVWEGTDRHQGMYTLIFNGMAHLEVPGGYARFTQRAYDPRTNTTTVKMVVPNQDRQNFSLIFSNTRRSIDSPIDSGITNVQLYRPTAVGSARSFGPGSLFLPAYEQALGRFVALRFMAGTNWNNSVTWTDRTRPDYSTQRYTRPGESGWETNGMAWEYRVLLCNETGKDLYINVPALADDDYVTKLAQLIRYGSDGNEPYTRPQTNPVYPPLNSNLDVYIEYSNEVWNYGFSAWRQNFDAAQKAVQGGTEAGRMLTYDGATDQNVLWNRRFALRSVQISNLFRQVFGDAAMGTRIRMLLEWQYANYGWPPTAETELTFLDDYFNNADGKTHVTDPHPVSYFIWGGGGAAYYGAQNEEGATALIKDGHFETPQVVGYQQAPAPSAWHFTATAGIARNGSSLGNPRTPAPAGAAPPTSPNAQVAYLQGRGTLSRQVTFPHQQTSAVYGLMFQAVGRKGAKDRQAFDVYIDGRKIDQPNTWQGYYLPGDEWERFDSATFTAAPGSTHTISFAGLSHQNDAVVFIDNVTLTSVDAIFAADIPAQSGGTQAQYQRRLAITGAWANLYGLKFVAYEGGWSLGGDAGGSPLQNYAKFHDPRAAAANLRSLDAFYRAGGALYTFGTYSQWMDWEDAGREPLPTSMDRSNAALPPLPDALPIPGILRFDTRIKDFGDRNLDLGNDGKITLRSLIAWNILASQNGRYRISAPALAHVGAQFIVDGKPLKMSGAAATTFLTAGLHSLRLQLTARQEGGN